MQVVKEHGDQIPNVILGNFPRAYVDVQHKGQRQARPSSRTESAEKPGEQNTLDWDTSFVKRQRGKR
ncbi:Zinc Finger Cchc Domain-Containing Protein 18 [Manis pentadactyla]|nr:Zinc Finger Cchc Domain-Containing Protein 18 [Manis pentadactyla]